MKKFLKQLNDKHWYLIAGIAVIALLIWIYGCQSTVTSLIEPDKKITRAELELETNYIIGQAKIKLIDLDRQDEVKHLILEQAAMFGTTGTFNPTGLLNTCISIGAIAFGLDRNKKLKETLKEKVNNTT